MAKRYHVIQVIADQHHAGLMGCAGHEQAITPNFDRFAAEGVRFSAAYAQNVICTPSRVSILSGQYCHNHGYYGLSGPKPERLPSFLDHFGRHGYRTAAFGKLHLPREGGNWLSGKLDRLADTYEDAEGRPGRSDFFTYLDALGLREYEDSWHNRWRYGERTISHDAKPSELPYEHTQERWCVREALRFIDEAGDQEDRPFCLQIAFEKPHHPLLPQQEFWDLYPDDLALPPTFEQDPSHRPPHFQQMWHGMREMQWDYAEEGEPWIEGARRAWRGTLACVSQIDDVFGRLLEGLEERGLREKTIIAYHSDHGCYHGIHGIEEKAPGICSEAVCRVPMIWQVPGVTDEQAGAVRSAPVENLDLGPTIASLCGLPAMGWADGHDLTPLLRGEGEPLRDAAFTENPWSKAMRWGKWRFVYYPPELFDGEEHGELYDLEADPDETRNLYHEPDHRDVVERCRERLLRWLIVSTRPVTAHPRLAQGGGVADAPTGEIAADAKLSNDHDLAHRAQDGRRNYL